MCPTFHGSGSSRCPGCYGPDFTTKHPSCSVITCCVKKHHFEVCAQCGEFPCDKFAKRLDSLTDSILTYKNIRHNMIFIKEQGLPKFIEQQKQRMTLLERMLSGYNEGRSKSMYCIAATLLPLDKLSAALNEADTKSKNTKLETTDVKQRAQILHDVLNAIALKEGIELKLRKGK
ncbi:MAG: hypothetical protein RBG13Loki_3075 [Promethearchaeota archaeon CR_4]|nr:MAG: hypothetical protein RBG13Loki_3075 [Candidatus Lokiarchaeota archaeon CR_4]